MTRRPLLLGLCALFTLVAVATVEAASERRQTPLVKAVQRAQTAVVNIHTEKEARSTDNIFGTGKKKKITGMGTGIIIDERGYLVTNYHVVADVDELEISINSGLRYPARVITFDRSSDLAILKIESSRKFDVMPMGTSSDLMLGETVFAVGNAFGYVHTVTSGIVSALSRDVEVNETQSYVNLIQTDASINPGNSGGPLINLDGEVIGINVAIRAGAQRIGFAIPIDDARRVVARLLSTELIDGRYHGLMAHDQKSGEDCKLVVESALPESPSFKAGFKPGDIVVSVNDSRVVDRVDFERCLIGRTDKPAKVVVKRGGKEEELMLDLAPYKNGQAIAGIEKPAPRLPAVSEPPNPNEQKIWGYFGMKIKSVSKSDIRQAGKKYNGGMMVTDVKSNGLAARHGIKPGDILVGLHVWETVNDENVTYVMDHVQAKSFSTLKFYILRGNEVLYGNLKL